MIVLCVRLEMFGQIGNALGEHCDLDFGRARVALAGRILRDYFFLAFGSYRHRRYLFLLLAVGLRRRPEREYPERPKLSLRHFSECNWLASGGGKKNRLALKIRIRSAAPVLLLPQPRKLRCADQNRVAATEAN